MRLQNQAKVAGNGVAGEGSGSMTKAEEQQLIKDQGIAMAKEAAKKQKRQLMMLQREKNRIPAPAAHGDAEIQGGQITRSSLILNGQGSTKNLQEKQKDLIEQMGDRLQSNSLIKSHTELKASRYFHGIVTFMSRPLGK